jgi:hypothetical protein
MSGEISIRGKVQDYDQKPIYMIQVTAWVEDNYSDLREVGRTYTDEDGMYRLSPESGMHKLSVLPGKPISIRFDTHWSLTNADEWHPAVIPNIDGEQDTVLNRFLMRVGTTRGSIAEIDALTAYQFCAMWATRQADRDLARKYAKTAVSRLSQMKVSLPEFNEFQQKLIEFFSKLAESS